ncbi:probable allantoate deiminase, partial [Oryza glaberrima]|uniref:probable allantoate deiminase n=1 Tax=Oryza glaberrima TaxID=4538 RepID=UPI00224BF014
MGSRWDEAERSMRRARSAPTREKRLAKGKSRQGRRVATAQSAAAALPSVCRTGGETPVLMSGTRHDAMAMVRLTKVRMLFVRCRGSVRHSSEESVLDDDFGPPRGRRGKEKKRERKKSVKG